jgi:hypothetical protein
MLRAWSDGSADHLVCLEEKRWGNREAEGMPLHTVRQKGQSAVVRASLRRFQGCSAHGTAVAD